MAPLPPETLVTRILEQAQQMLHAGRLDEAMAAFAQAMAVMPAHPGPYFGRGTVCMSAGQYEEALYWFEQTRVRAPDYQPALEGAGDALLALGRPGEAMAVFERLRTVNGKSDSASHGIGEALAQLGRMKEARAAFEQAVALAPGAAGHHYALAKIARFVPDDLRLPALERLVRQSSTLAEADRCMLHFACGKAYDELGRHEEAFAQFASGNAIKRRNTPYDEGMFLGILQKLADVFTPQVVAAHAGKGASSDIPVFVVGMPRSGTSLIEQIIASHPDAAGIGESMYLHQLLGQGLAGAAFPDGFADVSRSSLERLGALYVAHLRAQAPASKRIVDKLPVNFMLCGLIHAILPNARIIHVQRDPLDVCWSCYTNLFAQNIDYSYDQGELGRYYMAYDALMRHWHDVLPEGTILDVRYEALIGNFEAEARRIMTYVGLPWDAACLSFHRTERVVHTLSAAQVREPLYQRAVGRAGPYAPWLKPLRDALKIG